MPRQRGPQEYQASSMLNMPQTIWVQNQPEDECPCSSQQEKAFLTKTLYRMFLIIIKKLHFRSSNTDIKFKVQSFAVKFSPQFVNNNCFENKMKIIPSFLFFFILFYWMCLSKKTLVKYLFFFTIISNCVGRLGLYKIG